MSIGRDDANAGGSAITEAVFEEWRSVGCGVESLHHLLTACGVKASLDDVLRAALARDGCDEEVGWRHRALVEVAGEYGISGAVRADVTVQDFVDGLWLASVRAPEQFESTHLVAVRAVDDVAGSVRVFWPQGQLEYGERFTVPASWLEPRLTGRGMRFDGQIVTRSAR